MKRFLCFFLLLYGNQNFAQDSSRILIKADQLVSEVLTPEKIYQYPKFSRGKIIFKHQPPTEGLLNYNYLNGEIEFIGSLKDTLAIARHQMLNIQWIIVNEDTFYYDHGYLQQVLQTGLGRLAKRRMLIVLTKEKLGAFDRRTTTMAVETMAVYLDYYGAALNPTLKARENTVMAYRNEYFFGDNDLSFLPANKKNLLRMFPSRKEMINSYLKDNNVDFRNIDNLKNLFLALQ